MDEAESIHDAEFSTAWAGWLEACDSAKLTLAQRARLEDWAAPRLRGQIKCDADLSHLSRSESNPSPCFVAMEGYAYEHPITEVAHNPGKSYKAKIKWIAREQGVAASVGYATKWFVTMGRNIREEQSKEIRIQVPEEWKGSEDVYVDYLLGKGGKIRALDPAMAYQIETAVQSCVDAVFSKATDRQKLVYWSFSQGLKANSPEVAAMAGCGQTTAYGEVVAIEEIVKSHLHEMRDLPHEGQVALASSLHSALAERLSEWAKSKNLELGSV